MLKMATPKKFSPYSKPLVPYKPREPSKNFLRQKEVHIDTSYEQSFSLQSLKDKFPNDLALEQMFVHINIDRDYSNVYLYYLEEVLNKDYDKELKQYEKSLTKHKEEYKQYKQELKEWNEEYKKWEIEEKQKRFNKIEKEYKKLLEEKERD